MRLLVTALGVLALGGASAAGDPYVSDIYVVPSSGGARQALTNTPQAELQPALSRDGRRLAFVSGGLLRVMNVDGSEQRPLGTVAGERPLWSPDGNTLVYTGANSDRCYPPPAQRCVVADLWTVNADGTGERKIVDAALHPVWSPRGLRLLFRDFVVGEPGEVRSLEVAWPDGSHVRTLFSRENDRSYGMDSPAWSPNGKWIAFTFSTIRSGGLFLVRADGSHVRWLGPGRHPAWSPDGKLLAFERGQGLWIRSPAATRARRVTVNGACPAWSPRGKRIAFLTRGRGAASRLGVVRVDGRGRKLLANASDCYALGWAEASPPVWSRDGRQIYFVGY